MVHGITIINTKPDWASILVDSIRNWWRKITFRVDENYYLIN